MGEQVDMYSGQMLALSGRLRAQLESHYSKMSGVAAQICSSERWGDKSDEFTETFRSGENGYDAARNALLGDDGNMGMDGNPKEGGSNLGITFGQNGFAGLLDVLDNAALATPDQDGEGGKNIDNSGLAT